MDRNKARGALSALRGGGLASTQSVWKALATAVPNAGRGSGPLSTADRGSGALWGTDRSWARRLSPNPSPGAGPAELGAARGPAKVEQLWRPPWLLCS
jgi:hypothetical protein